MHEACSDRGARGFSSTPRHPLRVKLLSCWRVPRGVLGRFGFESQAMIVNFPRKNIRHDIKTTALGLLPANKTTRDIVEEIREGLKQVLAAIHNEQRRRRLRFQVFPRLMTKAQAANYCGVCVESFAVNCPVEPIRIRSGEKGLRWDTHDLDEWIESKKQDLIGSNGVDWLKRVG